MKKLKVCWLSAGVSSLMAGYLAKDVDLWIYIDVEDQHPDTLRFLDDIENALNINIVHLKSNNYKNVEECVLAFAGFKNPYNSFAPCTNYLKKRVRKEWEQALDDDTELTYVWGYDADEVKRAERLIEANPHAQHEFPLIDKCLNKEDVHGMFQQVFDFKRPVMYEKGYPNNNCVGCVKGGAGYWNMIRVDFPEVFAKRAKLERMVGHSILKDYYLDELPPDKGNINMEIFPECSAMCFFAMDG